MRIVRSATLILAGLLISLSALAVPKVIKKVPPEFPPEAANKGVNKGSVKAKITIEADGKVSAVEILEAEPKRLFDNAVKEALKEWRFEPGEKTTHELKLVFQNED
ncbi:TonB family protein [Roseateles paludis]|jgi:protein TonB|uniref:TonB family protein n=1 Tax=Roseateles paludis TaxID=3145238 RepID=A0ABV0G7C5_9BURK